MRSPKITSGQTADSEMLLQFSKSQNKSLKPRPTFFSAGVGWTGGRRNSSESGPGSSGSPQSKRVCPGISWRVTNDPEDSEDQGSEAEDAISWVIITDPRSFVINTIIRNQTYKHQCCEGRPPLLGQPILSSLKERHHCSLRTLQGHMCKKQTHLLFLQSSRICVL